MLLKYFAIKDGVVFYRIFTIKKDISTHKYAVMKHAHYAKKRTGVGALGLTHTRALNTGMDLIHTQERGVRELEALPRLTTCKLNLNKSYTDETVLLDKTRKFLRVLRDNVVKEIERKGLTISCKVIDCYLEKIPKMLTTDSRFEIK